MNFKVILGNIIAYTYNGIIGRLPSRKLRAIFLKLWLGEFALGTSVQMRCQFLNGRKIFLGKNNVINFGTLFDGRKYAIKTGDNVSIGPEATILTLGHDPQSAHFEDKGGQVEIGDFVWIGYRATILPGIKIGEGAVIGAGSLVSKDVPPYAIVAGNPARPIGERKKDLAYTLKHNPWLT